ncbi:MAG: NADH-quinone oxidoreductase subunit NuoG [Alphaproteobacteria bacterium]|nr:NADH-quinone oxidoreductase subunit NuoG [Alphaproteobacteria bacterium]
MIKLTINGQEVEVEAGTSVLQACEQLGIEIPRFCYHDRLTVAGSCRMCLVDVEKMPKPVASCALPCSEGMVVHTDTEAVKKERQGVMEMLLINHPLDCPVCDQGGECDLQDQAVAYGRDRCRYTEPRRVVRDKDFGPLIKTVMTRCIHCTRCVRFMEEIAGSPELGGVFRGEKMEITSFNEGPLRSEMSGNLVDVCPVGALTSKPYAFKARPWELTKTESIDVLDAVGSNIRIDTRGTELMRVLPRLNEDINEEWISDKTRFAYDGLRLQRLDRPYIREEGRLRESTWDEALTLIAKKIRNITPNRIAALAGDLVDCETLFSFKKFLTKIDTPHFDCRQDGADYDISTRAAYTMNSGIAGIEKADVILLVGTNPRHEATLVNARLLKRWRKGGCVVGMIGEAVDLGYPYHHVGYSPVAMRDLIDNRHEFADLLRAAKNPMIILGAGALARPDGGPLHALARELAESFEMVRDDWNGFNVLQLAAARTGGLDLGFVPSGQYGLATNSILGAAQANRIDVLYLMGADEIDTSSLGRTFVIYQGHHGDRGAARADVILPSAAPTEKDGIYVNTEGRPQMARRALFPPGQAREDWAILALLAQALGKPLDFDTLDDVRSEMFAFAPHLKEIGACVPSPWKSFGRSGTLSLQAFTPVIENTYMTDPISRTSPTMAKCTAEILPLIQKREEGQS